MTKQKSQSRFVVHYRGEHKRLFSIREGSTGDLLITTHLRGLDNLLEGERRAEIREYRDALHVSPQSESNTVHGITVHSDGSTVHRYLSTNALRDHRFQPLVCRSVLHPDILEALTLPAKGELITLPDYNPDTCTLHYSIWFCAPGDLALLPRETPYLTAQRAYREFGVIVAMCYSPRPSTIIGDIRHATTTTPEFQTRTHKGLRVRTGPSEGARAQNVVGHIISEFNQLVKGPPGSPGYQWGPPSSGLQFVVGWQPQPIF